MGKIMNELKRNSTKVQISSSGSTRDSYNEKIRNGQSYLYKREGMESEVVEIVMKDKVQGGFLNQALIFSLRRYPYFNTRILELDGDFYIVQNSEYMTALRTKKFPVLGDISCGHRLVVVTYYDKSIYVSFHHALCDGKGIKPFTETLVYYYCQQRYDNHDVIEGIRLMDDPLLEGETIDPYFRRYEYDKNKKMIEIERDVFELPESKDKFGLTNYRYSVTVPSSSFMEVCKNNNSTPSILVSLCMAKSIRKLYPEENKTINSMVAVDIRKQLEAENTFKNCVRSMALPYTKEMKNMSLKEQSTILRDVLSRQRDEDYVRKMVDDSLSLFEKLDSLQGYEEKRKMMSFFEKMSLRTYIISYLGRFILGSNERYVESIHFYNSGTAGLGVNMTCTGDIFTFDIKQSFSSDKYVKGFVEELEKLGIECKASDVIPFCTPQDNLFKRDGRRKKLLKNL